uniref:Uncharacterized protein n=1 Tax=Davidia involucrata TaxID=16924 RepID=A0A5B7B857_DAVIN
MDLKFKGRTLAGNIYQKFEAMCQEVDDFVSQDTVKYVENQVQTVGENVKKFCSDVVQDLLPPSLVDPVKCEAQAVSLKQHDAIGTYIRSVIGIEEKPVFIGTNQSTLKQDPLKNSHASSLSGSSLVKQIIPLPHADPTKDAESDLPLGQDDDALICTNLDMCVEEVIIKEEPSPFEELESVSPENKDSSGASLFSESIDEKHKNGILVEVSPETFVHGEVLESSQKEGTVCDSSLDEVECLSDVSSTLPSSQLALSVVSSENKIVEMGLSSFSSSLSTESHSLSELSHANFSQKAEKICYDPIDSFGCLSDLSGTPSSFESFPTVSCDNKVVDVGLAFSGSVLSLESNDEAVSLDGSLGNQREHCCECTQLEAFLSSLEIGEAHDSRVDIADPSMETIELSDKVKLDESCVIVDDKSLYAVSCRARKLRSYRKIIQDAFASKKRLRKEYEQLAIWYGDIDIEFSQQPEQNLLPSVPGTSLDSKKPSAHDICDSEWELL